MAGAAAPGLRSALSPVGPTRVLQDETRVLQDERSTRWRPFMLTKLTDEGRKTLKQNPNRTKAAVNF